jgi:hypothetical protein
MSAPQQGRQSPEPERQSDAQKGTQASNVNDQGGAPTTGQTSGQASDDQKSNLASNPTHPLEKHSEETTSKN